MGIESLKSNPMLFAAKPKTEETTGAVALKDTPIFGGTETTGAVGFSGGSSGGGSGGSGGGCNFVA